MREWVVELRRFYVGLDMTLSQLEETLGVDVTTLSRILNGKRLPEVEFLSRLSEAVRGVTGAPVTPEVAQMLRRLYFNACQVHDPHRYEVYQLKELLKAAEERISEAELTVMELRAQLRAEQDLRAQLESGLNQLASRAVGRDGGLEREIERATQERDRVDREYLQKVRSLAAMMHDVAALEEDREAAAERLRQAEVRLEEELERRWLEASDEGAGGARRWPFRRPARLGGHPAVSVASAAEADMQQLHAAFANLSYRTNALVAQQLATLIEMGKPVPEGGLSGPDSRADVYRLESLATRIRRSSENVLLLAGEDQGRLWPKPAPLDEVLRAAAAEVEQQDRVDIGAVPDVRVTGRVVNGLIRLVAELLCNATAFSVPTTRVTVAGRRMADAGVRLEIHDEGIGLSADALVAINGRLADPPPPSQSAGHRRLGLAVVGRLAAVHEIRVRLEPNAMGGTSALVVLDHRAFAKDTARALGPGGS